ncbi:hypothetical protein KFL_008790020 [Klebsormidium nitens]|uniref:Uncharacterized protein n=1 Tax=Klebsormidium nitens TaxID=105231 RepID=A0A1Y1IMM6_KLENI|nr:hypothetical protein KFL_008790020 [Klebsormidium nitens]|eukprot:GAQ91903.1 hypothetical protein KFL_008790020 [Klebsormidium nitens]
MLTRYEAMLGGEVAPVSADDESVYKTLDKRFVDHWAFQGEMGGSHIATQMYSSCGRVYDRVRKRLRKELKDVGNDKKKAKKLVRPDFKPQELQ